MREDLLCYCQAHVLVYWRGSLRKAEKPRLQVEGVRAGEVISWREQKTAEVWDCWWLSAAEARLCYAIR